MECKDGNTLYVGWASGQMGYEIQEGGDTGNPIENGEIGTAHATIEDEIQYLIGLVNKFKCKC